MKWVRFSTAIAAMVALSACGGTKSNEIKPTPVVATPVKAAAPVVPTTKIAKPGVKPHFVPCDPKRPELPCTPETAPARLERPTKPGVKPHFVPCDPERPELPCTPDTPPLDIEGEPAPTPPPKGVKPRFVPCDPARPDLPCTPTTPPPGIEIDKK